MSEEYSNQEQAADTENKAAPELNIKRIYLKDLSFETPMGLEAFNQQNQPKVEQEMNIQVNKLDEHHHEVILLVTIVAKVDDRTVFLIEVKQAGVFEIIGVDGLQFGQTINSMCPGILFPYAREIIDSTLLRGSFSALMLPPINFDAVFAKAVHDGHMDKMRETGNKPEQLNS